MGTWNSLKSENCPFSCGSNPTNKHAIKALIFALLEGIPNFDPSLASSPHLTTTCPMKKAIPTAP